MISDSLLIKIIYSYMLSKLGALLLDDFVIEIKKLFGSIIGCERLTSIDNKIRHMYNAFKRKKQLPSFDDEVTVIDD